MKIEGARFFCAFRQDAKELEYTASFGRGSEPELPDRSQS
jgi:hypothetical protein